MRHLLLVLSIAAISVVGARAARAQSAEAEALFNEGDARMRDGKLDEACQAFEASNRIEPRAGTLIRLGECREKNRQLASAWSAYKDALTRVKDPNKKAIATAKVAELEPKLSYMTISIADANRPPGLALARNGEIVDPALWNRKLPINGGQYIIVVRAPNRVEWTKTVDIEAERADVTVEVPVLADATQQTTPPPPTPPVSSTAPPAATTDSVDDSEVSPFTTKRKLAIGAAAVAVASVSVGVVLGAQARSKRDKSFSLCPDPMMACADAAEATSLSATAHDRAIVADVMFGVAGAAAIGAVVLWITGAPPDSSTVAIIPSTSSLTVVGHF